MSTHEVAIALSFLHITLTGSTELSAAAPGGCWPDAAPSDKPIPFVIYGFMTAPDTITANGVRLLTRPLYQVRASGPSSEIDRILAAAACIDDVLKNAKNVSVPGGLVQDCHRESPMQLPSTIDGIQWVSVGGLYRMVLQQVPN